MISEKKKGKQKNLTCHFGELSDKLLNKLWSVNRYCINSDYVLRKNSFFLFKVDMRR